MTVGPVQMVVVGFADADFNGDILREIDRLKDGGAVRLIDLLAVRKHDDGRMQIIQRSDLSPEEAEAFGAVVGALIGFGAAGPDGAEVGAAEMLESMAGSGHVLDPDDVWFVEETIPPGSAAAIALLEHRWAIGLRDAVRGAGGVLLNEAWIHPLDLVAVGLIAADEAAELMGAGS